MKVVVIGAGVAGAAAARMLRAQGAEVVVLEAADAVGGRTRTYAHEGFAIDSGAIFVMGSYDTTLRFLRESGHEVEMRRWIARTAVLDESGVKHPVRLDQPWTLLRMPQLTWGDRARMVLRIARLSLGRRSAPFAIDDLAAADDGSTLAAWSRRQFGERGHEYVVRPLMDPLTGADPTQISAAFTAALMGMVHRTQLTVPQAGMGCIASWLSDGADVRLSTPALSLANSGDGVTVDTTAGSIEADAAIVATDVLRARSLLDGVVDPAIISALDEVTPIPAYHVLLGYHRDPWPHVPYDLVVRAGAGMHHDYGALLNGRRAPRSVPAGGQSASVYFDTAQTQGLDEDQVVARACEAVAEAFGPSTPDFHRVFAMDVALIAPTPGHYRAMRATRDAMPKRIRLAGDFLTHSGIEGALLSGEHAARELRNQVADQARIEPTTRG